MCNVTRTFPLLGTFTCNNSAAANTHVPHTFAATLGGRNVTWLFHAPATGQTAVNADAVPSWPRTMQVGMAD